MTQVIGSDALQRILGAPDGLDKREALEKFVANESSDVLQ
jgi:hypothetical protein